MFGFKFIKFQPNDYVMKYSKGKVTQQGQGVSFIYYEPTTSIVLLPIGSKDIPFIFEEITSDYQAITIQGQVSYRIVDRAKISQLLNYVYDLKTKKYISDDPIKLSQRMVNITRVLVKKHIEKMPLKEAVQSSEKLAIDVLEDLKVNQEINLYGLEVMGFSILAISPNKETVRALEAKSREEILRKADEAIYERRNAAIEQERKIKENELNTEVAVIEKKKQITEAKLSSELIAQQKRNTIQEEQLNFEIDKEEKKKELVILETENSKLKADSKAYEIAGIIDAIKSVDQTTLKAIASISMNSGELIAMAFNEIANNANKIGELNISPDLLQQLTK